MKQAEDPSSTGPVGTLKGLVRSARRYWPYVSLLILLTVMISFFFWPGATQPLSRILSIGGTSMSALGIIFLVGRSRLPFRKGGEERIKATRDFFTETAGLLVSSLVAGWVAAQAAAAVIPAIGQLAEEARPGLGVPAGLLAGVTSALCVGIATGLMVRWCWRRLTQRKGEDAQADKQATLAPATSPEQTAAAD